jgi:hypothetical protein
MNDGLPVPLIPPNVQHLQHVQHGAPHPPNITELTPISLTFVDTPFLNKTDETTPITCTMPLFGFTLAMDTNTSHVYISKIQDHTSATKIHSSPCATCQLFIGSFIFVIDEQRVFTKQGALKPLCQLWQCPDLSIFLMTLADEPLLPTYQLRMITILLFSSKISTIFLSPMSNPKMN